MLKKRILKWGFLLFCGLFATCEIINPEEGIPAYLQINNFTFSTTAEQGANAAQITDAWVYVGDLSLGIYELPATVPVLDLGEQIITIFPVIRENGIRSTPILYPFYERYEVTLNLLPAQTVAVQPATSFIAKNTVFELVEDFEERSHRLTGLNPDAVKVVTTPTKVAFGKGAGQVLLDSLSEITFTSLATFTDLPIQGGLPVFLEINYKTNVEFEVGLVGIDPNGVNPINATIYKIVLCPIDKWNKVYINLQEEIVASQLPNYQLAFRLSTDDTGCGSIDNEAPELLIDNLKFIRFQN